MTIMIVMLLITTIIALYILITYNILTKQKNRVKQAASGIDAYLKQRFDLIPNLVECVNGYMQYEQESLSKIIEMKNDYIKNKDLRMGEELNNKFDKILLTAEDYPELKTSEQFLNLQKNLTKMESQLQAARRIYNSEVNIYNNKIQTFPNNIIAKIFSFKVEEYFGIEK